MSPKLSDPRKARLFTLVENAAKAVTDPVTGHFEAKAHTGEILARLNSDDLDPNVRAVTLEVLASDLASRFVNRRNPRPRPAMTTMFDPGGDPAARPR